MSNNLMKISVYLFLFVFLQCKCFPVRKPSDYTAYLRRFGYISDNDVKLRVVDTKIKNGIKKFQYFADIPETGLIDQPTMIMMNVPRCGNKEKLVQTGRRSKRYVLDSKWEKTFLTYRIINYPKSGLDKKIVDNEVELAFKFWENEANFQVRKSLSPAAEVDIEISFVTGAHNDGIEFNEVVGVGKVIAHAWKPFNSNPLRGDIHFNDEVIWTSGPGKETIGYDFLRTVTHEIGHAMGLEHSPNNDAVMYFAVTGYEPGFELSNDDRAGIQELYGRKRGAGVIIDKGKREPINKSKPVSVPSGTPDENIPWQCYRIQEDAPNDRSAIKQCYQDFYREFYFTKATEMG